uniref:TF-B3 domain-containing protein n=1 Tax=Aegilops tauschii subsp. strangulata TaxID=200361 RepID=A0A453ME62_AEGTS
RRKKGRKQISGIRKGKWRNRTRTRSSAGGRLRRTAGSWTSSACITSPPPSARPPPGPSPTPNRKPKAPPPGELRRSGRVASLPEQPNYLKGAQQRDYQGLYADVIWKGPTDEERATAAAKAEELQRQIHRIRWPAFVKPITHACASRAYFMTIPKQSTEYLPVHDEPVVVVDEADDESHMMYNASRQGRHCYLSKGWREFAVDYDLENGDCLVFQLIESAKFKVYIFRASPDYESDETSDDSEDEQK